MPLFWETMSHVNGLIELHGRRAGINLQYERAMVQFS